MMKVFCALFHDRQDGAKFGKILATEILAAFVEEYATDLGALGHNLKDFHGFNFKIIEIIRDCVRPILAQCTLRCCLYFNLQLINRYSAMPERHSKGAVRDERFSSTYNNRSGSVGRLGQFSIAHQLGSRF